MMSPVLNPDDQSLHRLEHKLQRIGWNAIVQHIVSDQPEAINRFCQEKARELLAKHSQTVDGFSPEVQQLADMIYQGCQTALAEEKAIYSKILDSLLDQDGSVSDTL